MRKIQREKRQLSGPLLEVDFFPVFSDGRRVPERSAKEKQSTEAQKRYNDLQLQKKVVREINANFDEGDVFMSPTYEPSKAPQTYEEVYRDADNYIRRVKRKRASELKRITKLLTLNPRDTKLRAQKKKLEAPFKYYYTVESVTYKSGVNAGRKNWHMHMFLTGGISRDIFEDLWDKSVRVNTNRFQPERFGPEAAAKYITKDAKGMRRIKHSRNITEPKKKNVDGKITKKGVELLAKKREFDREYWERRYKGFRFIRCFQRQNPYNGYYYVTVIMYRSDKALIPEWKLSEWMNE